MTLPNNSHTTNSAMVKKKGKGTKLQSKTRITEAIESSLFDDELVDESTESAVAALSNKTISSAPEVVTARQDVVSSLAQTLFFPGD